MGAHERHHAAPMLDFPGPHIHVRAFAGAARVLAERVRSPIMKVAKRYLALT
jgi:hypothetical protein